MIHSHTFPNCIVCVKKEKTNTSALSVHFVQYLWISIEILPGFLAWRFSVLTTILLILLLYCFALLYCYVFSHCVRCKYTWRLVSYFNVWNVFNVSHSGLTFTSLSQKLLLPMMYGLYGTQKTLVWWYACINALVCAMDVLLKRNVPTYCNFCSLGAHLFHSSWSMALH